MPRFARLFLRFAGVITLVIAGVGCRAGNGEPPPVWDVAGAKERATQAEARLRSFGEGRFEVVSFQAGTESTKKLEDDFHARSLLYVVPFKARVRFPRHIDVEREEDLAKHIGEPGWTPDAHRDRVMLSMLLQARPREAGQEEELNATVVFEDLEPGVRFRAFDENR